MRNSSKTEVTPYRFINFIIFRCCDLSVINSCYNFIYIQRSIIKSVL